MNQSSVKTQQSPVLDKMLQLVLMAGCFAGALMVGMESFSYMGIVVACAVVLLFGAIALGVELNEPWGGFFKRASASVGVAFIIWMTVVVILNMTQPQQKTTAEPEKNAVTTFLEEQNTSETQPAITTNDKSTAGSESVESEEAATPTYKKVLPAVLILGVFNLFGTLPLFWYAMTGIIPPWLAPKKRATAGAESAQKTQAISQTQQQITAQAQAQQAHRPRPHVQQQKQNNQPSPAPPTAESSHSTKPQQQVPRSQAAQPASRSKDMNYQPTSPTSYRPNSQQFAPGQRPEKKNRVDEQDLLSPPPKSPPSPPAPKDSNAPSPDLEGM